MKIFPTKFCATIKRTQSITTIVAALPVFLLSACAVVSSYHIEKGATRNRGFSTVAGDIHVDNGASIHGAQTVAGSIRVDAHASTRSLKTVAGSISVGLNATIDGNVETVAGSIDVSDGTVITGDVKSTAGEIKLQACTVEGVVRIKNCDINTRGTNLLEGIVMKRSKSDSDEPTRIDIGPGSVVSSIQVDPDSDVVLRISKDAEVRTIEGVEAEYF